MDLRSAGSVEANPPIVDEGKATDYRVNQLPQVLSDARPPVRASGSQIKVIAPPPLEGQRPPFVKVEIGLTNDSSDGVPIKVYSNDQRFISKLWNSIALPESSLKGLCQSSDCWSEQSENGYYVLSLKAEPGRKDLIVKLIELVFKLAEQEGVSVENRNELEDLLRELKMEMEKEAKERRKRRRSAGNRSKTGVDNDSGETLLLSA